MIASNFSGYGGGVSAVSGGPLVCMFTNPVTITSSPQSVIWDTVLNQPSYMSYSTTTGTFTATMEGIYNCQWMISFTGVTFVGGSGSIWLEVFLNGASQGKDNYWQTSYLTPNNAQIIFARTESYPLNTGDTLLVQINGMQTNTIDTGATASKANIMCLQGGN